MELETLEHSLFNRFAHSAGPGLKHSKGTTRLKRNSAGTESSLSQKVNKTTKKVDFGTVSRPLGRLWGAAGRALGVSGRPPGGVFGALGGILVALAAKKPSSVHKDAPKSPQGPPKREENGTGAPHFGVSGGPKMTKKQ